MVNNLFGLFTLTSAVISNSLGLIFLRKSVLNPQIGLQIIFVGYCIVGIPIFFPRNSGRPIIPRSVDEKIYLILWFISLSFSYMLFLFFPKLISPALMITALAFSPIFGAILSKDLHYKIFINEPLKLLPTALLILLAFNMSYSYNIKSFFLFILMGVIFSLANMSVRKLSKKRNPIYSQSRLAIMISIFFFILNVSDESTFKFENILNGLIFGLFLIVIFYGTLHGIKNVSPFLSTLVLGAGVPISIILQYFILNTPTSITTILFSFLYVLMIKRYTVQKKNL